MEAASDLACRIQAGNRLAVRAENSVFGVDLQAAHSVVDGAVDGADVVRGRVALVPENRPAGQGIIGVVHRLL